MPLSNKYKNALRVLRKNNSGSLPSYTVPKSSKNNLYTCLSDLDEIFDECEREISESNGIVTTKKTVRALDRLPVEMINNILEYLPINTRLAILKNKYNKKTLQKMLENMPKTAENNAKLSKCVTIASQVLDFVSKEERYHFRNSASVILAAIKRYAKIYKNDDTDNNKQHNNKRVVYVTFDGITYNFHFTSSVCWRYNSRALRVRLRQNELNKKIIEEMMFRMYAQLLLHY